MRALTLLIAVIWISGCSTSAPMKKLQTNGQSTSELMRGHSGLNSGANSSKPIRPVFDYNYSQYTRNSMSELDVLFPRLPNPTLVMYVYPHISQAGVPVPGYSTAFALFDKVEYALPGETPYLQESR